MGMQKSFTHSNNLYLCRRNIVLLLIKLPIDLLPVALVTRVNEYQRDHLLRSLSLTGNSVRIKVAATRQ